MYKMIKSSWASNNGKRMAKEFAIPKPSKISFKDNGFVKVYMENGIVKTYSNEKQVDQKVIKLNKMGYKVSRTLKHPFVIVKLEE